MDLITQIQTEINRLKPDLDYGTITFHIERGQLISTNIDRSIKTPKIQDLALTEMLNESII